MHTSQDLTTIFVLFARFVKVNVYLLNPDGKLESIIMFAFLLLII